MLPYLQRIKLTNLFNLFDKDQDGLLTERDIFRIVDACAVQRGWDNGQKHHEALHRHFSMVWKSMLEAADKNKDEMLSAEELLALYYRTIQNEDEYKKVIIQIGIAVFSIFDANNDGQLSLPEYQAFYRVIGLEIDLAVEIYDKIDLDSNGMISIDELIVLLDQFFRSHDKNAPGNFLFGPVE